ncbi:MAG TPA: hypothetical protein VGE39_00370 [Prosthecobacter sp.]
MRHLLSMIAALSVVWCDHAAAKTPTELREEIYAASEAAKESVEKGDVSAAEAAAGKATAALTRLRELHAQSAEESIDAPAEAALLAECEAEARKVGQWATLTKEKVARNEKLGGWRAKIYYAVQSATLKAFFYGLVLATDQAAAGRLKLLPQSVQDGAKEAAGFIESYVGPQRLASGELDWAAVGRELNKFAEAPPLHMRLLMVGLMLLGMDFNSAFYEMEAIPADLCKVPEEKACYHAVRGLSYLGQGYGQLAMVEFELADSLSNEFHLNVDPAGKCGIHLLLAYYFLREERWADADRCLASANRVWPDNPVAVYLTGERQIATNQYAAADESFAKALKGTGYEWLAETVAARVKRLRDSPASLEPVLFDFDLLAGLAWTFVKNESKKSPALKNLQDRMNATQSYLQELKKKLPDMGVKVPEWKNWLNPGAEQRAQPPPIQPSKDAAESGAEVR